jgi:predicted helicase
MADPIRRERDEADRIKREQRILAIIGNPPYWRFQGVNTREIVGPFLDDLWDDLKEPVRDAGWANQLNTFPEFSIAFWRWAIWKLFEADNAPKKGVIAFITNRTFLTGKPYAGLRKMLRERFDRIEVIDLRGDLRRGARAGVRDDTGVFNIKVGTAVTLAIADGSKAEGDLADVTYNDVWEHELFAREAKLEWLESGGENGKLAGESSVLGARLDALRPPAFATVSWPSLTDTFEFNGSGMQSKRDALVYSTNREVLLRRISKFASETPDIAREEFHDSRDRKWRSAQAQVQDEIGNPSVEERLIIEASYRPFDRRYLFNHPAFGDFLRPELQRAWGNKNTALYSLPAGIGEGPAVWCHGLLPDYHSFRGSYGGYAFPLFDKRAGHDPINISPTLLDGLELAYHTPPDPQAVFDAILALLSASSYTLRFAEDLEDVFPHVPFPAKRALFDDAAAIGKQIREVETFARPPASEFLTAQLARVETPPHGRLAEIGPGSWKEGEIILCENGSGRISGIPAAVWQFSVSGYPVLPRWLAARKGIEVTHDFLNEFRDITGRINELLHRFDEADIVLQEALNHSLTRERLGLESAPAEDENERP